MTYLARPSNKGLKVSSILERTEQQYDAVAAKCREIFTKKTSDYGTAWRILRSTSLTDQIYIKGNRIRTIQETGESLVGESIEGEFVAIVNYAIMALIQLSLTDEASLELEPAEATALYDEQLRIGRELMMKKNHDYGEAWRSMRVSSLCDLILMKVLRVKQIEDNEGATLISEGVDANFLDMLNYALFALILIEEAES